MSILQGLIDKIDNPVGYVYVMEFRFKAGNSYKVLYKIGVTKNKPIDRMLDIVRDFFMSRRYVPECRLIRYRKSGSYFELESTLHRLLAEYNYVFKKPFDGHTEFFDLDIDRLLEVYEKYVINLDKYELDDKLPEWAYSDEEIVDMDRLGQDRDRFAREK